MTQTCRRQQPTRRSFVRAIAAGVAFPATLVRAAETFPARPLRIIVPFAPGGSVDISARVLAAPLSEELGQSVVVDNKTGAGGRIGASFVAKAAPDGYTLLAGSSGSTTAMEAVAKAMPYHVLQNFVPLTLINITPMAVVAGRGSTAKDLHELLAAAKASPGKIGIGSAGLGSSNHLAIELLQAVAGVKFLHVPYKGSGQALTDLLGGQIPIMVDQIASSLGYVKQGQVRVLAVMSDKRSPFLPDVPCTAELGLPGCEAASFTGILAPVGLPEPVRARLETAIIKVSSRPDVVQRFKELGAEPRALGTSAFSAFLQSDLKKWQEVAAKAQISIE
ncbi:MAG TPA: tripartite tricarboxylate transporter substrate binding protein [Ramlibacter sp.]|nr:tripartite tricarboxylate transporter substrate binding protein [Ramlibacter sp.]